MSAVVTAVSRSAKHTLVKANQDSIRLVAGLGLCFDLARIHGLAGLNGEILACLEIPANERAFHLPIVNVRGPLQAHLAAGLGIEAGGLGIRNQRHGRQQQHGNISSNQGSYFHG